jgi:hypothetical protein
LLSYKHRFHYHILKYPVHFDLPARFIESELALDMVKAFLNEGFEGGRHERRVNKIDC